jgi:hypothetical protein
MIPNYVFEDFLFQQRLQRDLNKELEHLNRLLAQQVRLLHERRALMTEIHEAVEQRWKDEEQSTLDTTGEETEAEPLNE